jgi:hypothetical protein
MAAGHIAQFQIDAFREPGQCGVITAAPGFQKIRDFRRACADDCRSPQGASKYTTKNMSAFGGPLPTVLAEENNIST